MISILKAPTVDESRAHCRRQHQTMVLNIFSWRITNLCVCVCVYVCVHIFFLGMMMYLAASTVHNRNTHLITCFCTFSINSVRFRFSFFKNISSRFFSFFFGGGCFLDSLYVSFSNQQLNSVGGGEAVFQVSSSFWRLFQHVRGLGWKFFNPAGFQQFTHLDFETFFLHPFL